METVKLSKIVPDENQPRKYFAADKIRNLKESIKREGIITPLVVEKVGDGYLLLDGERRFRAATELGLKEVPVIVEEPRNATDRLVRQFTVQEQHEGWTPVEKANAILKLSNELKVPLAQVFRLLNVSDSERTRYSAFARLADKEAYIRSEVPLEFAYALRKIKNRASNIYLKHLKKDFTLAEEKRIEKRIIQDFKEGKIRGTKELSQLAYALDKEPKMIEKWLGNSKVTPGELYLETGAQSARALRNVLYNAAYIGSHAQEYLKDPSVKLKIGDVTQLKRAAKYIKQLLDLAPVEEE